MKIPTWEQYPHEHDLFVVTAKQKAVLDAVAAIPEQELSSSGNWYGWAKPIGDAERALREESHQRESV